MAILAYHHYALLDRWIQRLEECAGEETVVDHVIIAHDFEMGEILCDLKQLYFYQTSEKDENLSLKVFSCLGEAAKPIEEPMLVPLEELELTNEISTVDHISVVQTMDVARDASMIETEVAVQQSGMSQQKGQKMVRLSAIKRRRNKVPIQTSFICSCCKIPFSSEQDLASHIASLNLNKPCSICLQAFASSEDLQTHVETFHSLMRLCLFCDGIFHKSAINRHVSVKHTQPSSPVSKISVLRQQNEGSNDNVSREELECLICGQAHKSVATLKSHVKSAHFQRNENSWTCLVCDKTFKNSHKHLNLHLPKETYKFACPHCELRFWEGSRLQDHVRSFHTRSYDLQCKFCSKSFIRANNRSDHHRVCWQNPNRNPSKKKESTPSTDQLVFSSSVNDQILSLLAKK